MSTRTHITYCKYSDAHDVAVKGFAGTPDSFLRVAVKKVGISMLDNPYSGQYRTFPQYSTCLAYLYKCQITGLRVPQSVLDTLTLEQEQFGDNYADAQPVAAEKENPWDTTPGAAGNPVLSTHKSADGSVVTTHFLDGTVVKSQGNAGQEVHLHFEPVKPEPAKPKTFSFPFKEMAEKPKLGSYAPSDWAETYKKLSAKYGKHTGFELMDDTEPAPGEKPTFLHMGDVYYSSDHDFSGDHKTTPKPGQQNLDADKEKVLSICTCGGKPETHWLMIYGAHPTTCKAYWYLKTLAKCTCWTSTHLKPLDVIKPTNHSITCWGADNLPKPEDEAPKELCNCSGKPEGSHSETCPTHMLKALMLKPLKPEPNVDQIVDKYCTCLSYANVSKAHDSGCYAKALLKKVEDAWKALADADHYNLEKQILKDHCTCMTSEEKKDEHAAKPHMHWVCTAKPLLSDLWEKKVAGFKKPLEKPLTPEQIIVEQFCVCPAISLNSVHAYWHQSTCPAEPMLKNLEKVAEGQGESEAVKTTKSACTCIPGHVDKGKYAHSKHHLSKCPAKNMLKDLENGIVEF